LYGLDHFTLTAKRSIRKLLALIARLRAFLDRVTESCYAKAIRTGGRCRIADFVRLLNRLLTMLQQQLKSSGWFV
jgi:hypothetical protein